MNRSMHRRSSEQIQGDTRRGPLSTRLTLSELPDYDSRELLPLPPPPREMEMDLQFNTRGAFTRIARFENFSRSGRGELAPPPPPPLPPNNVHVDGEVDVFHDCMDLEENSTFSNMFDDLDLEGREMMIQEDHAAVPPVEASAHHDPVSATGNTSSRGYSCKRKSAFHHHTTEGMSGSSSGNGEFSRRRGALVLPPPTLGASSSRSVAMEGPRPQKTRLSSEFSDSESVYPSPRREYTATNNSSNVSDDGETSHAYPRAVRRAFPEGYRARRAALLDYPEIPTSGSYGQLASASSSAVGAPGLRGSRFHAPGSTGVGGQGLSRRIGRITSSRSLSANPSISSPRDSIGESRTRTMRMAILENGAFSGHGPSIRREVAANVIPGGRIHHPGLGDARQGFTTGRSTLFTCPPPGGMTPPQIALMESPELRSPPVFDGSQTSLRHPGLSRREISEGFMAIPSQEFEWEHQRPRFMAGGLAEILRALERVERDEDLTREQLMMLEATTFLFGGIGLHDDHSDWRLDIDNMSYEELLALGDRIGTVSTGLTEELIAQKLKKSTYSAAPARSTEDSDVKCCICQEEFEQEVELGTINCGHKYHTGCIRQWLLRKNSCPICKATGLEQD